ncbi:DNA topoisomerase III [Colwellia sp. PAMC 21821]|uniref:DNA topoisomerase III n=1 Tax=Colwellia sp. PAMC 21821 TaxID=1816219 RepID=UPI0009BF7C7B|nr:DNA topoisomerase III [Colwellia sp. PAMC 21821]ARD44364.1 DNA topoisomerase III [Colwellia sp. PAMC 21821]
MKLYIAEKPSLGRAIAAALPKPQKNHQGYIALANGDVVSWCIGHILEQANPENYDPAFKKWQMAHLPIVPEQWQLKPKAQTRAQLTVLRSLVKQADEIIHAGDPDREGQLLVDEVIDFFKVSAKKKQNIKRLLISDLNLPAVQRSLANLQSNQLFMPLSISALARSRADWLYGINMTRAYTLQGQKAGFNSVLSVGRVQTPLLGLVVRRQQEIDSFVAKDFYDVHAHLQTNNQEQFIAKWQPSEACQPHMDEEGRVLNRALAENVVRRIGQQTAEVSAVDEQQKKQAAPLPYNLSSLQIDAAKIYSLNAKLVLDVCQALYEKHKLITYPRSDCRYLPKEHHDQAKGIIAMLANADETYAKFAQGANSSLKSKAWNNAKVTAHHAIIPTEKSSNKLTLNPFEKKIYFLIVRQYLAQFYPVYQYNQSKIEVMIAGGKFCANAKTPLAQGWKVLFQRAKNKPDKVEQERGEQSEDNFERQLTHQSLPKLVKGEQLLCQHGELISRMTQAPKHFTDASLLSAMTGIARFVSDVEIKKLLRENDGLGTEATRAGIIDLLFKRDYLQRQGKNIHATVIGTSLINALPIAATMPDMTAHWEATLTNISEKKSRYEDLISPLTSTIAEMIKQSDQQSFAQLPKVAFKRKSKAKKSTTWKKKPAK